MPFTISHAAVARPLGRLVGRQLPVLALAVGALSPDLEFFLGGRIERSIGHRAHGVLLLDVPLGLAFLAALTWFVVPGIRALLTDDALHLDPALTRSFTVPRQVLTDRVALARTVLALMIGAGSHILWDEFTHGPTPDGGALGWLNRWSFSIGRADFALYSIVQWVSTAGGLAAVMIALDRWIDRQPRHLPAEALLTQPPNRVRAVGRVFVAAVTVGFAAQNPVALIGDQPARPAALGELLATTATWALSGCFLALALVGATVRLVQARPRNRGGPTAASRDAHRGSPVAPPGQARVRHHR